MAAIGTVSFLTGRVFAEDAAGNQRLLALGDEILEGERIIAAAGARIEINMLSGDNIVVADGQSWSPTSETFTSPEEFATDDATLSPADLALQQALLSGADPTEVGEATAAGAPAAGPGGAPGGGDGGTSFVAIARTAGEVNPSAGYETIATNSNIVGPAVDPQRFDGSPSVISVVPTVVGSPLVPGDTVTEGASLAFTVTLSATTETAVTYTFSLGGGSASITDYGSLSFDNAVINNGDGTITVPAGVLSFTVTLPTIDDTEVELTEDVPFTVGGVTGTGLILDNDKPSIIEVEPGTPATTDDNVVEGNNLIFNVTLSEATVEETIYSFSLGGGSATAGADYSNLSFSDGVTISADGLSLVIPAGVTSFSATLPTIDDTEVELTETVLLNVDGVIGTGGILDNDKPTIIEVEPGTPATTDDNVVEGNDLIFNVTLSEATIIETNYSFSLGGGSATAGADYTNLSFSAGVTVSGDGLSLIIPAGVITFTATLPTIDDTEIESTETVLLNVDGVIGTGGILDNDQPVITSVTVGNDAVIEGNDLVYLVTLSEVPFTPATYDFNLGGGSASTSDYGTLAFSNGVVNNGDGTITVPAGVDSFTATLPTVDDTEIESTETVPLTVGGATGTGNILDNDIEIKVGNPETGTGDIIVPEGNAAEFGIKIDGAEAGSILTLSLSSGTAENGLDFNTNQFEFSEDGINWLSVPSNGEITLTAAGEHFIKVRTNTVSDNILDPNETFNLKASLESGTNTVEDTAQATITDGPVIVVGDPATGVGDIVVKEGEAAVFAVTVSNAEANSVLTLTLTGNTATDAVDFNTTTYEYRIGSGAWTTVPGTGEIPLAAAGNHSLQVRTNTVSDNILDPNETFNLKASLESGTNTVEDTAQATITDGPVIVVGDPATGVGDIVVKEGEAAVFAVTVSNAEANSVLTLTLTGNTATDAVDFNTTTYEYRIGSGAWTTVPGTGEIPLAAAGNHSLQVRTNTVSDNILDPNETFNLKASLESGTNTVEDTAQATITDGPVIVVGDPATGVGDIVVKEGEAAVFAVTVSNAETNSVLTLTLTGNTATDAVDFNTTTYEYRIGSGAWTTVPVTGEIPLAAAGNHSLQVRTNTVSDNILDPNETFNLKASLESGTNTVEDTAQATITDGPVIVVGDPATGVGDIVVKEGEAAVFAVTVSNAEANSVLSLTLTGNTATDAVDFNTTTYEYRIGSGAWTTVPGTG